MKRLMFAAVLLLFAGLSFAQTMKGGGVVMIHEFKHTMDDDALKNFMKDYDEKITPLVLEQFPEVKNFKWVKGIGSDNKGALAVLIHYESLEDFRKYYNEDGTPTEKGAASYGAIMPVFQELLEKYGEITFAVRDWYIIP
jgi:hypothetical protein